MLRRTPLKRIGKIGRANLEARNKIAQIAEERNLNYCEIGLDGCNRNMYLAPAHRHKRSWYKGDVELLSDYQQWVSACVTCHNKIEHNQKLTEDIFSKLREEER